MITPPSAEVAIGGMVDFAVGTSGGSGDASWTCTSSDTAVATVETTDTGAGPRPSPGAVSRSRRR